MDVRVGGHRLRRLPAGDGIRRLVLVAVIVALVSVEASVAGTNPRYFPGDWTAYTSVRHVYTIIESFDFIYLGTRGGVARYDRFKDRWILPLTTADGLRDNNVQRLAYNPTTDELYADTRQGASVYRPLSREWYDIDNFPDSLTQPWNPIDLTRYILPFGYDALQPGTLTDSHLSSYPVRGGILDSQNTEWVGTWGIFVWTASQGDYRLVPQRWGLYSEDVAAIYLDSLQYCFGGPNFYSGEGAVSVMDRANGDWEYYQSRYTEGFTSDNVSRIVGKPSGRYLWWATDHGVTRFDRKETTFRTFSRRDGLENDEIHGLCLDGDILWVGSEQGIDGIYLPSDSVFNATTDAVAGARIYDIDVTGDVVWLGTDRGLYRLIKPTPFWQRFSYVDGPLSGRVRALTHDTRHLYVGTDRGIAVVDLFDEKPPRIYEYPSVLPDGDIYDLAVTDSIMWAATRTGLLRFVPATMERRMFTRDDGMLDDLVETIVVDGDYLWLGTRYGASRFRWYNPLRVD